MRAERKRAYDSTIHCTSATEACKSLCSIGSATLTTVPSIKAMLEPRTVAARIHGSLLGIQGAVVDVVLTTPLSHGGTAILMFPPINHFCLQIAQALFKV